MGFLRNVNGVPGAGGGGAGGGFTAGVSTHGNTGGTTGLVASQVLFVGSNNITLSQSANGNSATVSIFGGAGAGGGIAAAAGTQTGTSGTIVFANSNGLTFGMSGSSQITGSYTVPSTAGLLSAVNVSAGTTSNNLSALTFNNGNGVSFGLNGSTLTASIATSLTNINVSAGTTSGNLSAVTFANGNGVSFGLNAGTVTASHNALTSQSNQNVTAANGGFAFETLSFSNANGVSFGTSAGSAITASHNGLTTARASTDAIGLNTAQSNVTWTVNSSGLSLDARGYAGTGTSATNASITLNSNGLAISVAAPGGGGNFSAGVSTGGNTSGDTGITGTRVVFAGGNNITVSQGTDANGATITISGANAGGAQTGISGIAASNTTYTSGSVTFRDGNGLSWASTTGQQISLTHDLQFTSNTSNITSNALHSSASRVINIVAATNNAAGGTASLSSNVSFSAANGLTFYTSAGNAIVGSHNGLTTARASNDAIGLNTAKTNVTWTVNSSGLSLDAGGYAGTGTSATNASITLNSNGLAISVGAQSNQTLGIYASSQTGGVSSSSTYDARSLTIVGSGEITVGWTNGSLMLSAASDVVAASASNGSFSFQTLGFSNANNVTFGTSAGSIITASVAPPGAAAENNAINLLGANTAGNTTATGSTIGWSGVNLTFSGTNDSQVVVSAPATSSLSATGIISISTTGSTISIGAGRTISGLVLAPLGGAGGPLHFAQSSISLGQNSLYVYPVQIEDYLTVDHIRMPVFLTNSSSAAASVQKGQTFLVGIYSRNATNATVLTRMYSTSYTIAASHNSNASWMLSLITAIGNSTSYNTLTASSAGVNLSSSLHGPRELIMPVSTLLSPGDYFIGVVNSTSSAGAGGAVLNISNLAVAHQTYNRVGIATNATGSGWFQSMCMGTYSATTGALPGGISATQINQLGTMPVMFAAMGTV